MTEAPNLQRFSKDFQESSQNLQDFQALDFEETPCPLARCLTVKPGEYGFARWTLQRLERLRDSVTAQQAIDDVFPVQFDGRDDEVSLDEVIETLRSLMDIAFKSVLGVEEYDAADPLYAAAKELFVADSGTPSGAVLYGLFLNQWVAAIYGAHPSMKHSVGAVIENVQIHDLDHATREVLRMDKWHENSYRNPFGAAISAEAVLGQQVRCWMP